MTDEEIQGRVGTVIDRWTLQRVIGRGGMAAVYEGVDEDGTRAAVKVLHDAYVGRGSVQRRFLREAFIIGVAKHPRAVKIFAQGLGDGTPFFAMEFVDGETLQSRWSSVGRMPPEEVVAYAKSLLDILAAYHKEGVVHRDIKPANLIVSGRELRLIDFGVARYRDMGTKVSEYTRDGATLGTPPFMAPEQALGKIDRIDQRSDIFAVGALMYSLLTAQFVHRGDNNDEILIAAASTPAESLIVVSPKTPEALVRVVDKALSFYPDDRYADAGEMLAALQNIDLGLGLSGPLKAPEAPSSAAPATAAGPDPVPRVDGNAEEVRKAAAIAAFGADAFASIHTNITDALEVMFRGLKRVFDSAQLYDASHPKVRQRIDEAYELVNQILHEYPEECAFVVRMSSFQVGDTPIWTPKAPFDQIPYRMFINGLRVIRFLPGLTVEELRSFLLLIIQPASELPAEDDLGTALWDMNLRHIQTTMVTSFTVSDDVHEQNAFETELNKVVETEESFLSREGTSLVELLGLIAETGDGGLAQAHMTSRDALIGMRLAQTSRAFPFREQFVDALKRDNWELRTALVISAALEEAWNEHDLRRMAPVVGSIFPRYFLQGRVQEAFLLAQRVVASIKSEKVRERVLEWLFDPKNLERLMLRLAYDPQLWDDETRKRASTLLALAPSEGVDEVLPMFTQTSDKNRRVVMTYLMRNGAGRQQEYVDLARDARPEVAQDIVRVVERIDDPDTPAALMKLTDHPAESVRALVLEALSNRFPNAVEEILAPMMEDESAHLRVQALRIARNLKSDTIRGILLKQAQSSRFHSLPFTERRLMMETIQALDAKLAEETCVELARRKLNLTLDPAMHTTRIMALTFLGEHGLTRDGWEALEDAAKRRPGNPQNVRDAATAAIEKWRDRAR